jgi:hypothetical protein
MYKVNIKTKQGDCDLLAKEWTESMEDFTPP